MRQRIEFILLSTHLDPFKKSHEELELLLIFFKNIFDCGISCACTAVRRGEIEGENKCV